MVPTLLDIIHRTVYEADKFMANAQTQINYFLPGALVTWCFTPGDAMIVLEAPAQTPGSSKFRCKVLYISEARAIFVNVTAIKHI
jgi:hypothetical protein